MLCLQASCRGLHHSLLRRMSDAVLDMARHGISAESGLAPDRLTAYEAAALLATCRGLARQHAAVLSLAPALEDCSRTAAAIEASLQCMARAWAARQRELGQAAEQLRRPGTARRDQQNATRQGPLNGVGLSSGNVAGASKALGAPALADTARTEDGDGVRDLPDGGAGGDDDEELLLQQAQELDGLAGKLRAECEAAGAEFEERWVEACIASPRGPARWLAAAAEASTAGQEAETRHAAADPTLRSGTKGPVGADLNGLSDLARKLWLEDRCLERDQDHDGQRDQDQHREPAGGGSRGSGGGSTSGSSSGGADSGVDAGGTVQRELWPEPLVALLGLSSTGRGAPSDSTTAVEQAAEHEGTAEALRQRAADLRASWQTAAAATAAAAAAVGTAASSQREEYTLGHWSPGEGAPGTARVGGRVQGAFHGNYAAGMQRGCASTPRSADVGSQRPVAAPARESSPAQVDPTGLAAFGLQQQPRSTAPPPGQPPPAAQPSAPGRAQQQQQQQQVLRAEALPYQHSVNPHSAPHREPERAADASMPRYLTQEYARSTPAADSDAAWHTPASPELIADLYGMGRAPGGRPASGAQTSAAPRTELRSIPDSPANTGSGSSSAAAVSSPRKATAPVHAPVARSVAPAVSWSVSGATDSVPLPSLPTDSQGVSSAAAPPAVSATGSTAAPPAISASTTSACPPASYTASSTALTSRRQQQKQPASSHAIARTPREASSVPATVTTPGTETTSAYASRARAALPANTPASPLRALHHALHHAIPVSAALRQPPDAVPLMQPPADDGPAAPPLPRIPLPDDLSPSDAAALGELWALAALHYQRTHQTHEGAMQTLEKRWERCQAQLQVLQTEELAARTTGRAAEAAAAAAASSRWQRHASDLQASMRRHSSKTTRLRAHALRATATCERLQLLAAAAATIVARSPPRPGGGHEGRVRGAVGGMLGALVARVPRLPGSTLARSGVVQALDGLHGELAQHEAAVAAAAGEAQRRSQKVFAKAAERGEKLKQVRGMAEGQCAILAAALGLPVARYPLKGTEPQLCLSFNDRLWCRRLCLHVLPTWCRCCQLGGRLTQVQAPLSTRRPWSSSRHTQSRLLLWAARPWSSLPRGGACGTQQRGWPPSAAWWNRRLNRRSRQRLWAWRHRPPCCVEQSSCWWRPCGPCCAQGMGTVSWGSEGRVLRAWCLHRRVWMSYWQRACRRACVFARQRWSCVGVRSWLSGSCSCFRDARRRWRRGQGGSRRLWSRRRAWCRPRRRSRWSSGRHCSRRYVAGLAKHTFAARKGPCGVLS